MRGKGPYCLRDEFLDINVRLLSQPKGKPRSPEEANRRSALLKKNISHFYGEIYAALTGGKAWPLYKTEIDRIAKGIERNLHPDIVKRTKNGIWYTEVKASSHRSARFHCGIRQAENYFYKILERMEKGDKSPRCDYAFFRYGVRDDVSFGSMPNEELETMLCDRTKFLLIMPSNLAMFLFLGSPQYEQNQETSGNSVEMQMYFNPRGGMVNSLFRGREGLEALTGRNSVIFVKDWLEGSDFAIENLKTIKTESPKMKVNGKELRQFGIMQYYLPNGEYKAWLEHFKAHHERILGAIGIRDLYAERDKIRTTEGCSD